MATDRTKTYQNTKPPGHTIGEVMDFIRELIVKKKTAAKHCTVSLDLLFDDHGEIVDVLVTLPKVKLRHLKQNRG